MRPIDADWLLDVVENIIEWDTERDRNRIIHQVRELTPTIEPERKKGKWINYDDWCGYADCSVCGKHTLEVQEWGFKSNYCLHCGARMENSHEDD